MHHIHDREESLKKLNEMIKGIKVAMLTTATSDGMLRSRPMATQQLESDGDLWFFAEAGSPKMREIEREHHVNVSYADPSSNRYVSVSGMAMVVRDQAKVEEMWQPALKAWFPQGKTDPNIAMLRVRVSEAELWDAPASSIVYLAGFIKALATGKKYHPEENEKLHVDDAPPVQAQPGEGRGRAESNEPLKKEGDPLGREAGID